MKQIFTSRKLLLLCICLSLVMALSCAAGAEDEDMRQKFESGMDYAYADNPDYVRAVAAFTMPAKSGYPRAALELGNIYREGSGSIKQNLNTAESWYLAALEAGNPEAGLELGILYEFYKDDSTTAEKYYEQYENSGIVDFETALITVLYMQSAMQDDASSQYEIGKLYEDGTGVNADNRKAFAWYLKSANGGYEDAKQKVAEMYINGIGVAADPQKAQKWQSGAVGEVSEAVTAAVPADNAPAADPIVETVRNAQLGDVLYFGRFEQDNNNLDGVEDLKWKVINKQGNSSLLLCEHGIETLPYNSKWESTTWENSTLRKWLNGTFYEGAFNEAEKSLIQTTVVKTEVNKAWNTLGGEDTTDNVFLLSIQEVEEYLGNPNAQNTDEYLLSLSARTCEATVLAKEHEAYVNSGKSLWWLRSPGSNYFTAAAVNSDGTISKSGNRINYEGNVVRPAIWLTY